MSWFEGYPVTRVLLVLAAAALLLPGNASRTGAEGSSGEGAGQELLYPNPRDGAFVVHLAVGNTDMLGSVLVGDGIEGFEPEGGSIASEGGLMRWEMKKDKTDRLGLRHVFYEQRYRAPSLPPELVNTRWGTEGVRLVGGHLGLHYAPDGSLQFVYGAMFEDVEESGSFSVTTAESAFALAHTMTIDWPGFERGDMESWSPEVIQQLRQAIELRLWNRGDGSSFRHVWVVPTLDVHRDRFSLILDAESGTLLSVIGSSRWAECGSPDTSSLQTAKIDPQNDSIADRTLGKATTATTRGAYTLEANWPDSTLPEIRVWVGKAQPTCPLGDPTDYYKLLALKTVGGYVYDKYSGAGFDHRNMAGDAIWHTRKTFEALHDIGAGWRGLDGSSQQNPLSVVVNSWCGDYSAPYDDHLRDNAAFWDTENPEHAPAANTVEICRIKNKDYSVAAALDVVAHEWGHGVSRYAVGEDGWDDNTDDGNELDEGFADVIGYMVEWNIQDAASNPSEPEFEEADWIFGEDIDDALEEQAARKANAYHPDPT